MVMGNLMMMAIVYLSEEFQDSNGDGDKCNAGDLGVDEDFSEQKWM